MLQLLFKAGIKNNNKMRVWILLMLWSICSVVNASSLDFSCSFPSSGGQVNPYQNSRISLSPSQRLCYQMALYPQPAIDYRYCKHFVDAILLCVKYYVTELKSVGGGFSKRPCILELSHHDAYLAARLAAKLEHDRICASITFAVQPNGVLDATFPPIRQKIENFYQAQNEDGSPIYTSFSDQKVEDQSRFELITCYGLDKTDIESFFKNTAQWIESNGYLILLMRNLTELTQVLKASKKYRWKACAEVGENQRLEIYESDINLKTSSESKQFPLCLVFYQEIIDKPISEEDTKIESPLVSPAKSLNKENKYSASKTIWGITVVVVSWIVWGTKKIIFRCE